MEILIQIQNGKTRVSLLENKQERDGADILEERLLSEKLLPTMDRLIRRNKLAPGDIKKVRVESDQGETFTSTRLAKSVAQAWNWGVKK